MMPLSIANGRFMFPLLILVLIVVYAVNRFRNNRKFRR